MKKIKLTNKNFALLDDDDFEYFNQWRWQCSSNGYATRCVYLGNYKSNTILMHRAILEYHGIDLTSKEIDHYNLNKLDNRKENLRTVVRNQNNVNSKLHQNNKSGYKGVYWDSQRNKWVSQIMVNYKHIFLGRFINKKRAALAYNQAAKGYFGEYVRLNYV